MDWLVNTALHMLVFGASVLVVSKLMPSVSVDSFATAVWVAVVYAVLKFFLYWVLVILSLPFIVVTLGLYLLVINALLLWMTVKLVGGFHIEGFFNIMIASVLIALIDWLLTRLLPDFNAGAHG